MMIEQQSGSQQSETASSKPWIETTRNRIEKWEEILGLSKFKPPKSKDDAIKYLEMDSEDRSKMSCEDCAEAVVVLAQYAAYVGRAAQREDSESILLKGRIFELLGDTLPAQKAYSAEERMILALAHDDEAYTLEQARLASHVKSRRLFMYADRIDKVARAYEVLSNSRKRNRQYGD